jgi:hypothetical protein
MSLSLYWRRPPVEVETRGGVGLPLKRIITRRMFDNDGSIHGHGVLVKGSADYHYFRGVLDTMAADAPDREGLTDLLALADEHGAAEVFTAG